MPTRNTAVGASGFAFFVAGTAWNFYSFFTTASQIPNEANRLKALLSDPPVYFPLLVMAVGILLLAWIRWSNPSRHQPREASEVGKNFTQNHSGSGNNTMNID